MEAIAGPLIGSVVGGVLGGDGGGEQQTNTKEPWAPARQNLIDSLGTGRDLERYYQQNPFNRLQQQGYQNMFSDLDQFRSQISPQLMNFANRAMTSNYQRGPRQSQMEAMQGGGMQTNMKAPMMMQQGGDGSYAPQGGMSGAMGSIPQGQGDWRGGGGVADAYGGMAQSGGQGPAGGLLAALGGIDQTGMSNFREGQGVAQTYGGMPQGGQQGLLGAAQGAFSAPSQGNYGLLDFQQLNPFTSTTNGIPKPPPQAAPPEKTPAETAQEEWERLVRSGMAYQGAGA